LLSPPAAAIVLVTVSDVLKVSAVTVLLLVEKVTVTATHHRDAMVTADEEAKVVVAEMVDEVAKAVVMEKVDEDLDLRPIQ
jgi:hypothetical protein